MNAKRAIKILTRSLSDLYVGLGDSTGSPREERLFQEEIEAVQYAIDTLSTKGQRSWPMLRCGYFEQYKALRKPTCGCWECNWKWENK